MVGCQNGKATKLSLPLLAFAAALAALASCSAPAAAPEQPPTETLGPVYSPTPAPVTDIPPTVPPTITLLPTVTRAPSATPIAFAYVRARSAVTVFNGPDESFVALALLLPDERVELHGRDESGEWFNIHFRDGRAGWVSAALLQTEEERALATANSATSAAATDSVLPPLPATQTTTESAQDAAGQDVAGQDTAQDTATQTPIVARPELPVVAASPALPTAGPALSATDEGQLPPAGPQRGVQIFALCDNPALGEAPPAALAAGSVVVIWWGWLAETRQQIAEHLEQVEYEITLDGAPLANWREYQGAPLDMGANWAVHWYVPFPRALAAGEHRVEYRASWRARIYDGVRYYGPGTANETETGSCTFQVVEGE